MGKDSDFSAALPGVDRTPPDVPGFKLVRWIGGGSYGDVWLGQDVLGQWRAVKVVHRARLPDDESYEREFRGIKAYAEIAGKEARLLRVYHAGREDVRGFFYYAMELADPAEPPFSPETYVARTLKRELGHTSRRSSRREEFHPGPAKTNPSPRPSPDGGEGVRPLTRPSDTLSPTGGEGRGEGARHRLPFKQCLVIAREIATALDHLHQRGLVHRDVKPSNIVFIRGEARLADIGLVAKMELSLSQVGTANYLPQEGAGTPQGDLYALGKVLYEICTGQPVEKFPALPILSNIPNTERKGIRELNQIVLKACNVVPARRYQSAKQFIRDLDYVDEGSSLRALRWMRRSAWVAAAAALVMGGLVLFQHQSSRQRDQARRREVALGRAAAARVAPRAAGWLATNEILLQEAWTIEPGHDLLEHRAAIAAGLDARQKFGTTNFGGSSVAFDQRGRLVVGGLTKAGAHLLRLGDLNHCESFTNAGVGPVRFDDDGTPLQFVPMPPDRFALREADTGRTRRTFPLTGVAEVGEDHEPVLAMAANGSRVAAVVTLGNGRRHFAVWDVQTDKPIFEGDGEVSALSFSPDGRYFARGDQRGEIVISRLEGGEQTQRLSNGGAAIRSLAFTPDPLRPYKEGEGKPLPLLVALRRLVAAGDSGGIITIYEPDKARVRSICLGSPHDVDSLTFHPNSTILASGGRESVRLWDVASGRELLRMTPTKASVDHLRGLAFSPNGRKLATASKEVDKAPASTTVWEIDFGRGIQTLRGLSAQVSRTWWSPDGKRLAGLAHNWNLAVWEMPTGRPLGVFEVPNGESADNAAVAFATNNQQMAFASGKEARIYDLQTGRVANSFELPMGYADHLRYVDEHRLLLLRREYGPGQTHAATWCVRNLFPPQNGQTLFPQKDTNWWAYNMALPQRGGRFFVWNKGGSGPDATETIRAFDLTNGLQVWSLPLQLDESVLWCDPRGEFGAYSHDKSSRALLVHLSDGKFIASLEMEPTAIFPTLKRYAVSGGKNGGCVYFAPETPQNGLRLAMDWRSIQFPEFSPDGKYLSWGTQEGTVLVADLDEVQRQMKELRP